MSIRTLCARAGLALAATLVALLACEALARWSPLRRVAGARTTEMPWLTQNFYRLVDRRGYEIIPNAMPEISNLGMRGPDRNATKAAGTKRILVVGDSVAYGIGVSAEETFAAVLERIFAVYQPATHVEVLNAGVAGYNTVQELAYLDDRGFALEPDLVVLAYCPNDVLVTPIVFKDGDRVRFYCPERERAGINATWFEHSSLYRLWIASTRDQSLTDAAADPGERPQGIDRAEAYAALRQLAVRTRAHGIPLLTVIFPLLAWDFAAYDASAKSVHVEVARVLGDEKVPVIDLLDAWRDIGAKNLRSSAIKGGDPLHPNALGHQDAARRIHRFIIDAGWLDRVPATATATEETR